MYLRVAAELKNFLGYDCGGYLSTNLILVVV